MEHKMKYKKHIIANLDILNFKQIIQQDTYNELFANLFSIVNAFSKMDTAFMHLKGIQTAVLSDSFIFSIPFSPDASFEKILSMVYVVQRILMENQILTRGAISVGQLYHADNVVFGPALVDAYLLQEYNAIYPRCLENAWAPVKVKLAEEPRCSIFFKTRMDSGFLIFFIKI